MLASDCVFEGVVVVGLERGFDLLHDDLCLEFLRVLRENGEKFVDYCDVVAEYAVFEDGCQSFVYICQHFLTLGMFVLACLCLL